MRAPSSFIRRIIYLSTSIVLLVFLIILKTNREICEWMMRNPSRIYEHIMTAITGFVPFSLTELFFVTLIGGVITLIVFFFINLKRHKKFAAVNRLFEIAFSILFTIDIYFFSCEFAYNREPLPLPYYEAEVDRTEFVNIYNYFADDINTCIDELEFEENHDLKGRSLEENERNIKEAYKIINDDYFHPYFGKAKPMLSSFLYREFQITGVTNNALGEANINTLNTNAGMPFTIAHELAHTRGVMREDDANQVAFYVCINSDDPYLRYSAYISYFYQIESIASKSYLTDEERSNLHQVKDTFYLTRKYVIDYWKEHNLLGDIGEFFNNLYIKSSGVDDGTNSYSGGTSYDFDPTTNKLRPSKYQKLFFEKYYR